MRLCPRRVPVQFRPRCVLPAHGGPDEGRASVSTQGMVLESVGTRRRLRLLLPHPQLYVNPPRVLALGNARVCCVCV